MPDPDIRAGMAAKDAEIAGLVEQAAVLVADLHATVADMKRVLLAAQGKGAPGDQHRPGG